METSEPNLEEAQQLRRRDPRALPGKLLAYNCSPSFNWKKKLDDATIAKFQRELNAMGYKFQFITLAGFHASTTASSRSRTTSRTRGMTAYAEFQQRGVRERTARLHRDAPSARGRHRLLRRSRAASSAKGSVSTTALEGSTEAEQFYETKPSSAAVA